MLQRIDAGTNTNAIALERIESTLSARVISSASSTAMSRDLVDAEALTRLTRVRQSRFFVGARPDEQAQRLAGALLDGDLALASVTTKARGLAWCARILVGSSQHAEVPALLTTARRLADIEEVALAEALQHSHVGDLDGALDTLSKIESRAARSMAFIAIKNQKNHEEALVWLRKSGVTHADLDSDGHLFVIATQLDAHLFDDALASCAAITTSEFEQTPALWYVAANALLASVVPQELAALISSQPPFTIASVPLADDVASVETRRKARYLYEHAAVAAREFECHAASYDAADRALLLGLRDANEGDSALIELKKSMRSPEHSLRRLPIALQFDLKVDLRAAEQEIDRHMALSGDGSTDSALARLAIAQTKNPRECAEYLQKYRHELTKHLNPSFLAGIEIHSLVESGQLPLAEERLEQLLGCDVSIKERTRLSQIIAEARESNPAATRERQFATTNGLIDLKLLVEALERDGDWPRLNKYAALLFQRTRDVPSCQLVARSLFEAANFDGVVALLRAHDDLLVSSERLQSLLAWSLFNLGHVSECLSVLTRLRKRRDTPGDRALAVNVAIASGDWYSLASYVEREWERRTDRSAEELLRAGQIARQLTSPRTRALLAEAAAKATDNPHLLLQCYSSAMAAGWEDENTFKWMERPRLYPRRTVRSNGCH